MKQAIIMGIMAVLFMTVLTACGNSAEADHSQEVQDMVSTTMDAEYAQKDTEDDILTGSFYTTVPLYLTSCMILLSGITAG